MEDKKEELSSLATTESSNTSSNTNNDTTKQKKRQTVHFPREGKILHLDSKVNALAIKCYDEQLVKDWDYTVELIRNIDKTDYYVEGICHDRDTYAEAGSFWKSAYEKRHYHILFKCKNSKGKKSRIRVRQVMEMLGIAFRQQIDDELWRHHGVETIRQSFAGYSLYLTHDTHEAIADGKEQYDLDEVKSNLTMEELEQIRDGYIRLADPDKKVTVKDMEELDIIAYNLGKDLKDFSSWYDSLDFKYRSHSKITTVIESYSRGVKNRIKEDKGVLRLCVFVQGQPNTGKTYAALHALDGKRIHTVEGGGTGKFDALRADHEAIIISDDTCPNLLNMSDNYICMAYRRGSNNPAWAGNYFIVTSNMDFVDWVRDCGVKKQDHIDALKSRFFICEIEKKDDEKPLRLLSASTRGTEEERSKRMDMFMEFQNKYNSIMSAYVPEDNHDEEQEQETSDNERVDYEEYMERSHFLAAMLSDVSNDLWNKLFSDKYFYDLNVKPLLKAHEIKTFSDVSNIVRIYEKYHNKQEDENYENE